MARRRGLGDRPRAEAARRGPRALGCAAAVQQASGDERGAERGGGGDRRVRPIELGAFTAPITFHTCAHFTVVRRATPVPNRDQLGRVNSRSYFARPKAMLANKPGRGAPGAAPQRASGARRAPSRQMHTWLKCTKPRDRWSRHGRRRLPPIVCTRGRRAVAAPRLARPDADVVAPSSRWAAGPIDPADRVAAVSERNLFCLSVHGDSAVAGGADHGLHEIELRGGARARRCAGGASYTRALGTGVGDGRGAPARRPPSPPAWTRSCACGTPRARRGAPSCSGTRGRSRRCASLPTARLRPRRTTNLRVWPLGGGGGAARRTAPVLQLVFEGDVLASADRDGAVVAGTRPRRGRDSPRSPRWPRDGARHRWRRGTAFGRPGRSCAAVGPSRGVAGGGDGPTARPQRRCRRCRPCARAAQVTRRAPPLCRPSLLCVLAKAIGDHCCSGGGDGMLLVHDLATGGVLYGLGANRAAVRAIHCETGRLVAAGDDGTLIAYDFGAGGGEAAPPRRARRRPRAPSPPRQPPESHCLRRSNLLRRSGWRWSAPRESRRSAKRRRPRRSPSLMSSTSSWRKAREGCRERRRATRRRSSTSCTRWATRSLGGRGAGDF